MKRVTRKTLLLAALLGVLFLGVVLSAVMRPASEDVEVQTRVIHEMVAGMDGWMQRLGFDAVASSVATRQNWLPWAASLGTLLLLAIVLLRASDTQRQHESRNKRS